MSESGRNEAALHFERGNSLDEAGHRDAAVAEWQQAVRIDPDHAGAHYNLGIAYADNGEPELAIAELRESLRLDPLDVETRRELADIYIEQHQLAQAINQLRQALNITSTDGEIAHTLASLYLELDQWDAAAGALDSGALLEVDADLFYRLGRAYEQQKRNAEAILAYRRALVCRQGFAEAEQALQGLHVPIEEASDPDGEFGSADSS